MRALNVINQPVLAGIDVGNGMVKVATNSNTAVGREFAFQSTAIAAERLGEGIAGTSDIKPVFVDGKPWVVGIPANASRNMSRAIHKGAHFSDEHYALFLEAIGRIGLNIDIAVVGMTVDQIGEASRLKEKFQAEHRAHGHHLNVARVGVYPQPRGTAELYLQTVDDVSDQSILILDLGEGTTDVNLLSVATTDDGGVMITIDPDSAMSEWIGVGKISETIAGDLRSNPAVISNHLYRQTANLKGRPLWPLVERTAEPFAKELATLIKTNVRSLDDIDVILLTGGGAHVFGSHLKALFGERCVIMDDAGMANARGFLMMAENAQTR